MMRSLSKAGALFMLGLLLMPPVFAHTPAKRKSKNADEATTSPVDINKPENSPASAVNFSSTPATTEPAPQAADKKKDSRSSRVLRPAPKFTPMLATTGTLGLFTSETADTMPRGGFAFSAYGNKLGRTPGSVTILQIGVELSYGVTDRINVYGSFVPYGHVHVGNGSQLSLAPQNSFNFPYKNTIFPTIPATGTPGYVEDFPFASANGGGLGNITLGVKVGLLSERLGNPVSVSLRNELITSSQSDLTNVLALWTQGPSSDLVSLAVSKQWSNVFTTTFNAGYMFTRDPRNSQGGHAFQMADQFKTSAGFLLFPESRFQPMSEYSAVVFRHGTPNSTFGPRDPVEAVWGVRIYPSKYVAVDIGYRHMVNLNQLNDRHGFVVKLGTAYWPGKEKTSSVNHSPTISISAEKNLVYLDSGDAVTVKATAADLDNDPLTYTWSANCGHIDGDGPQVRWLSAGMGAGTCTVTAKVDDARGGHASSSTDIRVEPRPRQ